MTLDLNAIRKRAEAASSGPWAWEWADNGTEIEIVQPHLFLSPIVAETGIQADAEFIAACRQDVPALIAEVERLRTEIEVLRRIHGVEGAQSSSVEKARQFIRMIDAHLGKAGE